MAPMLSHTRNTVEPGAKLGENAIATSVLEADGATTEHALLSPHKDSNPLRICRHCRRKALTEADLKFFKSDKKGLFGYENCCKECRRIEARQRYWKNQERLKKLAQDRYYNNRKRSINYTIEYLRKHPEKHRARVKAQKVKISTTAVCSRCGSPENLVRHHPDYSKPRDVVILCKDCHGLVHRKEAVFCQA